MMSFVAHESISHSMLLIVWVCVFEKDKYTYPLDVLVNQLHQKCWPLNAFVNCVHKIVLLVISFDSASMRAFVNIKLE